MLVKKKEKNSVNQNFEALKAQMQAKRKLAENRFEKEIEKENELKSNTNTSANNITKLETATNNVADDNEYITLNIIDDEVELPKTNTIEEEEKQEQEEPENTYIPIRKTEQVADVSVSVSKMVIKKVEKQEPPKRITYYLKPDTIKKIDKFSKAAGMGKSEFVQTILEEILSNLEIEK